MLDAAYPPDDLDNKSDPLDEILYIILSGQTGEGIYQPAYAAFKAAFPSWEDVAAASVENIALAIKSAGLSTQKAAYISGIARETKASFGQATLDPLWQMKDADAENYLCSLPGVGIKSARCVLMYTLGRTVFPADIHCLRVMSRLGWIDWHGQRNEYCADAAQNGVPPRLRKMLHIRFIQHGRAVCRARPKCEVCVLNKTCRSAFIAVNVASTSKTDQ